MQFITPNFSLYFLHNAKIEVMNRMKFPIFYSAHTNQSVILIRELLQIKKAFTEFAWKVYVWRERFSSGGSFSSKAWCTILDWVGIFRNKSRAIFRIVWNYPSPCDYAVAPRQGDRSGISIWNPTPTFPRIPLIFDEATPVAHRPPFTLFLLEWLLSQTLFWSDHLLCHLVRSSKNRIVKEKKVGGRMYFFLNAPNNTRNFSLQ